jgi:hypothetical protein
MNTLREAVGEYLDMRRGAGGGCDEGFGHQREPEAVGEISELSLFASEQLFLALGEHGFIVTDSVGDQVPDDACQLVSHGGDGLGRTQPSG